MKEQAQIYVIIDASAGFKADGKSSLMRNTVHALMSAAGKELYKDCSLRYFTWTDDMNEITDPDEISFSGRADLSALENAAGSAGSGARFLLLSDGIFDRKRAEAIKQALKTNNAILVPVAVGSDADVWSLEQIAVPVKYCYQCVNILSALFEICFRNFYSEA